MEEVKPLGWPTACWCGLLLYWLFKNDLLTGTLGIGSIAAVWLTWSVLDIAVKGRNDSENELLDDKSLTAFSKDWRRPPTTPTSRLIAPTTPDDLESGDGTCTGSVEEEYTPTTGLLEACNALCCWELLDFATCTLEVVELEATDRFSSDTTFLSPTLELASLLCLGSESIGPLEAWCELRASEGFKLLEIPVELLKEK